MQAIHADHKRLFLDHVFTLARGAIFWPRKIVCLCLAFIVICGNSAAGQGQNPERFNRFVRTHPAMGVKFTITLYAADEKNADAAFEKSFARIDQLDRALSDYKSSSEIRKLCSSAPHANWQTVSQDLFQVLQKSQLHHETSNGRFDVTLGNLTRLWRQARIKKKLPAKQKLATALDTKGMEFILLSESNKVKLTKAGMRIDLGGIAKGFAADCVLKLLVDRGISSALVDASGDIVAGDPPPGEKTWQVELDSGGKADKLMFQIANQAIATSGDRFQSVIIDGRRYSHIVDPQTGLGLSDRRSVTVIAQTGTDADALASSISVLGGAEGIKLANKLKRVEAYVIEQDANDDKHVWKSKRVLDFVQTKN